VTRSIRITGLGGSLGDVSSRLSASRVALEAAREAATSTRLLDIRVLALPMFIPDVSETPQAVCGTGVHIRDPNGHILGGTELPRLPGTETVTLKRVPAMATPPCC
jgi:hypothetical protein